MSTNSTLERPAVTVPSLIAKKRKGEKIVMLTAYDYVTARILDRSGIDLILVGDSLGNVILGYDTTLPVTLDDLLHHTKAVSRGVKNIPVIADMPFLSYQVSIEQAVENAGRCMKEAGTSGVKLEGGSSFRVETIKRIIDAGIPVMGHIGLTPQSYHLFGGYKPQGRSAESAIDLLKQAKMLEEAGVFSIVIENIPAEVAREITESISVPTIGIGAGPYCDGQVLVINDMIGLHGDFVPRFAKQYADFSGEMEKAVSDFAREVRDGIFPSEEHTIRLKPDILTEFNKLKNK